MQQNLNNMAYFVHVVNHGGFAAAGRALGEPKSKLSRRVADLEASLGVQLLQRSTRRFSVTDIGQSYYRHCQAMLVEADAAQELIDMSRAEPCGVVRLTCPVALLEANVASILAQFMREHPRIELHVEATDRAVDPVAEAVDLAIRVRPKPLADSGLVMRGLGDRRQCLLASPALLAELGTPHTPGDLAVFPSLGLGRPQQEFSWWLRRADGDQVQIKHQPRLVTQNMTALCRAAAAGVGVVQLPHLMVRDALAQDLLVELLPEWAPPPELVHVVFASPRGMLPSVRALIDYLVAAFAALPDE